MKILRKIWARQRLFSTIFVCSLTVLVVSFSLSTFLVLHAETAEAAEGSWATMAEMPTARSGLGVAVVYGKIYAIGGSNGSHLNTNEEYDPAINTWATKKRMPIQRHRFAIAVVENKIYVIGGEIPGNYYSGNQVYDPATDTWETKTSMPTARADLCASVVNGKIYVIGGGFQIIWPRPSNLTEVYDPETDSWTTKASMPTAVYGCVSAVINNRIYVLDSNPWGGSGVVFQIYDPETDSWSHGKDIPKAVVHPAAAATTGVFAPKRIHILGTNTHQVYDPEKDVWSNATIMPTPRKELGVVVINDTLYAIGGGFPESGVNYESQNENEQYTPSGYETIPQHSEPFPKWIAALIVIIAVVGVALLVYFRKIKKTTEVEKMPGGVT
jgi:energy-converting hydrogenase Eha subunit A